jgi:hypothetical protein
MNTVYNLTPYFSKIHFDIILPSTHSLPTSLFPWSMLIQIVCAFLCHRLWFYCVLDTNIINRSITMTLCFTFHMAQEPRRPQSKLTPLCRPQILHRARSCSSRILKVCNAGLTERRNITYGWRNIVNQLREKHGLWKIRQFVGGHLTLQFGFTVICIFRSITTHSMRSECCARRSPLLLIFTRWTVHLIGLVLRVPAV